MQISLYTDGGARGNPGHAGVGCVLFNSSGDVIKSEGEYIGETTNNVAEYRGLIKGLKLALGVEAVEVNCYLDSELVVKQLNGEYRVKDANLRKLFDEVLLLKSRFKDISFNHVPRSENKIADKLVNEAIDKKLDTA